MGEQAILYVSQAQIIPLQELYELSGEEDIHTLDGDRGYQIVWPDVTLTLEAFSQEAFTYSHQNLVQYMRDLLAERKDKRAAKALRRAENMGMAYQITVQPGWDMPGKAEQLLAGVIAFYDYAFIFAHGAFYNENGNRIVGPEDSPTRLYPRPEEEDIASPQALARKRRSIARLKREKVPYIDHLPVIIDENDAEARAPLTAAQRTLALVYIADYANTGDRVTYLSRVEATALSDSITPEEWEFAHDDEPPEYMVDRLRRRYESAWTLLWALGHVDALGKPDHRADLAQLNAIVSSTDRILTNPQLRPLSIILDELDLTYRYHWALMDAELYGTPRPAGLIPQVTQERHHALNWLIGYRDQDWDEVSTDT